jgi:hypothetical protein
MLNPNDMDPMERLRAEYRRYVSPRGLEHIEAFLDTLSGDELRGLVDWSGDAATISDPAQYAAELWEEWGRQLAQAVTEAMDRVVAWWRECMPAIQRAMQDVAAAFVQIGTDVAAGIADGILSVGSTDEFPAVRDLIRALWGDDEKLAQARARARVGDRQRTRRRDVAPAFGRQAWWCAPRVPARVGCAGMRL